MSRYAMIIDLRRCIGCNTCSITCKIKNATPPGVLWSKVIIQENGVFPKVRVLNKP